MTEPLIMESINSCDSCVIWLHGLGANKHDFASVAKELRSILPKTRFILPQAPVRPVTFNAGFPTTSWYDIIAIDQTRQFNTKELEQSADYVISLIEQAINSGIAANRIVLAGFSQGGAVVLHTGILRWQQDLAGILALSTYAPTFADDLDISPNKQNLPVMIMHGTLDNVVPIILAEDAYQKLQHKTQVQMKTYEMAHQLCGEQLGDIANFLVQIIAAK